MKKMILFALLLIGCVPGQKRVCESHSVVIIAKENPVESHQEFTMDGKLRPASKTVYYFVYSNGTKDNVPLEKWAMKKIGDTVSIQKCHWEAIQ